MVVFEEKISRTQAKQSKVGKVKAKQNGIRSGLCLPLKNRINGMDAVEIEG